MNFLNLVSITISVFLFIIIMTGVYYSITFTYNFDKKSTTDKTLGVVITIATIISSLIYIGYYIFPVFKQKIIGSPGASTISNPAASPTVV